MTIKCNTNQNDITSVHIGDKSIGDKTSWIIQDNEILVPKEQLELGNALSVTFNSPITTPNEVLMLSSLHGNIYKTINAELEMEFVKKDKEYPQSMEMVARAVNRWNKTFVVDEYYSFGIQSGRAYFAKTSYHEEGENGSFAYKQLINLVNKDQDSQLFFKDFSDEIVDRLNLDPQTRQLRYNIKYQFKSVMKKDTVSFYIKEVSNSVSQGIDYEWLPLYEDISINVKFEDISNRNIEMDRIISAPEPVQPLTEEGLFGLAFPNSFVRLYRYEVTPFDVETEVKQYNDTEYSKNIATDFSIAYRNNETLKLNGSDSRSDNTSSTLEFFEIEANKVKIEGNISREDLQIIQLGNVEQKKGIEYDDRFIDVSSSFAKQHEGSQISTNIDKDDKIILGQQDEYFVLGEGDGIEDEFQIPDEALQKLNLYPNARIGAVLVEIPNEIKHNDFGTVGVKENLDEFYSESDILKEFRGESVYIETNFRGQLDFFQMGIISDGKFTFEIESEFLEANDSYDAIWKYNIADFIDRFPPDTITVGGAQYAPIAFDLINQWQHKDTIGYVVSNTDRNDLIIISESTLDPDFLLSEEIPDDIQVLLNKGMPLTNIRELLRLMGGQGGPQEVLISPTPRQILIQFIFEVTKKTMPDDFPRYYANLSAELSISGDMALNSLSNNSTNFPSGYIGFRETWFRFLQQNMHSSNDEIVDRKVYTSYDVGTDVFISLSDKKVRFNEPVDFNKKVALRVYYDNIIELTPRYAITDTFYNVPDNIKELYASTDREKGPDELLESFDPSTYKQIKNNDITFVVIPNDLLRSGQELYADITICSPFIEADDPVKRHEKMPLREVDDLLGSDFDMSQYSVPYTPQDIPTSGAVPIEGTIPADYNRPFDYTDELNEILRGDWPVGEGNLGAYGFTDDFIAQVAVSGGSNQIPFDYGYPRVHPFPGPFNGDVPQLYTISDFEQHETPWFDLFDEPVEEQYIDQYLDVTRWLNTDDNRLSNFNRAVLSSIKTIMSRNRKYTDQTSLPDNADPFDIDNWFDGFYSGELSPWVDTFIDPGDIVVDNTFNYGRLSGSPWGTQNSRKQMIDQLKGSVKDKFPEHTLFYIDLSLLLDYNKTTLKGLNSNVIDPSIYPNTGLTRLIDNPFVDTSLKSYKLYSTGIADESGSLTAPSDFSRFTDIVSEYPEETRTSFPDLTKFDYNLERIFRPIVSGIDLDWDFNTSIMFKEGWSIPEGTYLNAEYEYVNDKNKVADNTTFKIAQKVTLKKALGIENEKFPNPDVIYNNNIDKALVHKVWLDNYIPPTDEYDIIKTLDDNVEIEFTNTHVNEGFDVAVTYTSSNFLDLKVENKLIENFDTQRDFKWVTLSKETFGYVKKQNLYGMVTDNFAKIGVTEEIDEHTTFDGDDHLKSINSGLLFGGYLTICLEFYVTGSTNQKLLSTNIDTIGTGGWNIMVHPDGNLYFQGATTSGWVESYDEGGYALKSWHKMVCVASATELAFWVDGKKCSNPIAVDANMIASTVGFFIGIEGYDLTNNLDNGSVRNIELYANATTTPTSWIPSDTLSLDGVDFKFQSQNGSGNDNLQGFTFVETGDPTVVSQTTSVYNTETTSKKIWRKSTLTKLEDGSDILTTSGTVASKEILHGLQRGLSAEDTIELLDYDRTNNFVFSTDIYFNKKTLKDFMTTGIMFRGAFNFVNDKRYYNEYYSIILGNEKYNIGLICNYATNDGVVLSQELATVSDSSAIIKKDTWYTLKFSVIKDVLKVYFNVKNQKETFYFQYNLNTGRIENASDVIMDDILVGGLGVTYQDPKAVIRGSKFGISLRSDNIYFSDLVITGLEESNLTMNDSFTVNRLDEVIETLKTTYELTEGRFKKMRKTVDGYTYLLIDNSLFAKRGDGTYIIHTLHVDDFEIHDRYIYVVERISVDRSAYLNVYIRLFETVNNVLVNGKAFINEPMFSYIRDFDKELTGIQKVRDDIFLTFDTDIRARTWADYFEQLWSETELPWIDQ